MTTILSPRMMRRLRKQMRHPQVDPGVVHHFTIDANSPSFIANLEALKAEFAKLLTRMARDGHLKAF